MVSFLASVPATGSVSVDFVNQSTGNNTGYLDKAGMLAYGGGTWDAVIQTTLGSASARTMLSNLPAPSINSNSLQARYWLKGPIVTQVIVEDKSSLAYDFGSTSHKSLHPVFVLTFYPNTGLGVEAEYILENMWATKLQDQSYNLTLTANGATKYSKTGFNHTARSRWHKTYWAGTAPSGWTEAGSPGVTIDYNLPYTQLGYFSVGFGGFRHRRFQHKRQRGFGRARSLAPKHAPDGRPPRYRTLPGLVPELSL
jgi:hypothetical protein